MDSLVPGSPRSGGSLRTQMLRLAGQTEDLLAWAVRAFVQQDLSLAARACAQAGDAAATAARLDRACVAASARHLPSVSADDGLTRLLRVGPRLERVCVLAGSISSRVLRTGSDRAATPDVELGDLANAISNHFTDAVDAFVRADPQGALAVLRSGRALAAQCHTLLAGRIEGEPSGDPAGVRHIVMVIRDLDHVLSHADAIAEDVLRTIRTADSTEMKQARAG